MARTKKIVSKKKTAPKVEKKTTPRKKTVTKKTTTKKKVLSFKDSILKKLNSNPLVGSILKIVTIVIGIFLVVVLADYAVQYVRNERSDWTASVRSRCPSTMVRVSMPALFL